MKLYLSFNNLENEKLIAHNLLYKTFNIKDSDVYKNEFGKPYLKNNSFYFSLSHSKGVIGFIKSDKEIGLDIELIRDYDYSKVSKRVLNDNDLLNVVDSVSFLKIWTIKEAFIKYLGVGLSINLKDINIDYKNSEVSYKNYVVSFVQSTYNDIIYTIMNTSEEVTYEIL